MKYLIIALFISSLISSKVISDFSSESEIKKWEVEDDVVMGGKSSGKLSFSDQGNAVFEGNVSLENNGGFSSIQYRFDQIEVKDYQRAVIKLKGDGKQYQFRIKASQDHYYSYVFDFQTSGEWEEIEIPFGKMYPIFRGRKLDKPHYAGEYMDEVRLFIGNGRNENFRLLIDKIELR